MQRWIERLLCAWLVGCFLAFVLMSWSWPLTGDASLMHYVVFLMHHGKEPYRDIIDMNLPASYMVESVVMSVLGPGSMGWRLYDFLLITISAASLLVILQPQGWLPGILASTLFALIHGRDGTLMSGERDFTATVLLLAAVAAVFVVFRRGVEWRFAGAASLLGGLLTGVALTIKPPLILLAAGLFFWVCWVGRDHRIELRRLGAWAVGGTAISFAASLIFLLQHHAVHAFWGELRGLISYHASLNRWPIAHLLKFSLQPLLPMLLLWLVAVSLLRRRAPSPERIALIVCALGGLLSYLLQQKAFWYQRYPFLAFLLPLFLVDFTALLRGRSWGRAVGVAGILSGIVIATACLLHLRKYDRTEPPRRMLHDLAAIASLPELSGEIQCMDTIGGCIDALYNSRTVQRTGFIYDCYLLDGTNSVALDLRRRFWQQMGPTPPQVIVVTDSNCYNDARTFDKFGRWPEFQSYLNANYMLARESGPLPPVRYWSHPMQAYQYRIYVRR